MYLTRLQLEQFRNYIHLDLAVPRHGLLLFGANASGKTSFLEALYLLATTRSPRAEVEIGLSVDPNMQSATSYDHGSNGATNGAGRLTRKRIKVNGVGRHARDA